MYISNSKHSIYAAFNNIQICFRELKRLITYISKVVLLILVHKFKYIYLCVYVCLCVCARACVCVNKK